MAMSSSLTSRPGTPSMTNSTSFLRRASKRTSSRLAAVRPARCSIRRRFISFANSRQNSSKNSWRISLSLRALRTRSSTSRRGIVRRFMHVPRPRAPKQTSENGGGSGTWRSLLLVKFAVDFEYGPDYDANRFDQVVRRDRQVMMRVGAFGLDDSDGAIAVRGDTVEISADS